MTDDMQKIIRQARIDRARTIREMGRWLFRAIAGSGRVRHS